MTDLSALTSDLANKLDAKATGKTAPERQRDQTYVEGFVESAISGMSEFITGADPTTAATEFRIEKPASGFVSQIIGPGGLYGGTAKLPKVIKPFGEFIDSIDGANAITRNAKKSVATFAPLEAARIGGTLAVNPENIGETVQESLLNLGIEAVGGGLVGALRAGGKVAKIDNDFAPVGSDLRNPTQLKMRELKEKLDAGEIAEELQGKVKGQLADLETLIKTEEVAGKPPVGALDSEGDPREINRLFKDKSSKAGNIVKTRLIRSGNDFVDDSEKNRVIDAAGLRGNFDAVQLPRYVGFKADRWAKKVEDDLVVRGKMQTLDGNTLVAREKSGMHVIAKKITGEIGEAKQTDEWVLFRTDQPGRFVPEVKEFADTVAARMAFLRQDNLQINPKRPATIMDSMKTMVVQTPIKEFREFKPQGKTSQAIAKMFGMPEGQPGTNFAANRGAYWVERYLTPKLNQFKNSPVATYVMAHSDSAFRHSKFLATKLIRGEKIDSSDSALMRIFKDPEFSGKYAGIRSLDEITKDLDADDRNRLYEVAEIVGGSDDPIELVQQLRQNGEISEKLAAAFDDLNKHDELLVDELLNHQHAAGRNDLNPIKGHFMLSRVWEGDFRAPIKDEAGNFVYVAGGETPEQANKIAQAVLEESGQKGLEIIDAERFDAMESLKLAGMIETKGQSYKSLSDASRRLRSNPQTFKERTGTGGYKTKFSQKELFDRLSSHVNERYNYMARVSVDTALEKEIAWLRSNDPKTWSIVEERLRQMEGKPGAVGTAINTAVDTVLKPALGRNSATKISAFLNETVYHLQLGMANVLFPAQNATTFVQTVLPEVAYVMNAADIRLIRDYYDVMLAGGKDLKPRGNLGVLSPIKLTIKGFSKLANGDKDKLFSEMLDRGRREGVIDPQLMNEFVGHTSEMATTIGDVMKGDEPFINLIRTWSSFLPQKSERFARGHAFATGYNLGKDILGLGDEQLYQFARKFTERTMYNYGTADRATLMTGPLGRTFGLFKNWQTHYIFSMMQYAGEFKRGNFAPLLWQMGGTASLGGIAATPIGAMADTFLKMTTDESLMQHTYEMFGGTDPDETAGGLSDAVFMGLPAFMGVSMTGNAAAPFSNPMRDASQLMSFPQWDRMRRVGIAAGDAIDTWTKTGDHPIQTPEIRDKFIAALAPKALARSFQITENNALKSLNTGNVILDDMSVAERTMWSLGVTPRRVGVAYEAADELWKDQKKRRENTTKMGRRWLNAQNDQDWDELWQIQQESMIMGLDISSVTKSANTQREKKSTELIQRQFSPESRLELQQLGIPGF